MADTTATTTSRSQTRRKAAATDRSTAAKKAAATRARNQVADARKRSTAAKKAAETRRELQRTPVERYVDLAGRAVTIPVGAALVARDNVVALATKYDSLDKVERELRAQRRRIETDLRPRPLRARARPPPRARRARPARAARRPAGRRRAGRPRELPRSEPRAERHHGRHAGGREGGRARRAGCLATARPERRFPTARHRRGPARWTGCRPHIPPVVAVPLLP
jgi:hypothetical protein